MREAPGSICRSNTEKGTEGFRADNKRTCRREIPSKEDTAGDGRYNWSEGI